MSAARVDEQRFPGDRATAALVVAFWIAGGIFFSVQVYLTRCGTTRYITLAQSFAFQMPCAAVLCIGTFWVIRLSRRYRIERSNWRRRVAIHLGYCLLFTIVIGGGQALIDGIFKAQALFDVRTLQVTLYFSDRQVAIYLAVLFITHTWDYYWRFSRVELRASRLQTELANSRLELLKSQIHPHFLFNALNTISSVISENPVLAERLVARLGQFLRATLVQTHSDQVPLEQELELLDAYLDIQRLRFEDHLRIEMDVAPETLEALVPSLLLQPIAENAIKYGVDPRHGLATLTISARAVRDELVITVRDTAAGTAPAVSSGLGIGLANTRSRLQHLYGDAQSLDIENSGAGFVVSLRFPLVRATDALDHDGSEANDATPLRIDPVSI